jgi:hypothetical protein
MSREITLLIKEDVGGGCVSFTFEDGTSGLVLRQVCVKFSDNGSPLPLTVIGDPEFRRCLAIAADLARGEIFSTPKSQSADLNVSASANSTDTVDSKASEYAAESHVRLFKRPRRSKSGAPVNLAVNYWRLGSVAKVAKHYEVPRQVAQDWIKELRQQGSIPDQWSGKR